MYLNKVDDLRNLTILPTEWEFVVAGYWTPGDGGGGTFVWIDVPFGPYPADDNGIIIHNTTTLLPNGYFKRIYSGPINVRWFGAKGDGSTDDTAAVHKARDAAQRGNAYQSGTVYFPQSIDSNGDIQPYVGAFVFEKRTNIIGDGIASILQSNLNNDPILTLGSNFPYDMRKCTVSNITIRGVNKGGDGVYFYDSTPYPGPEWAGKWTFEHVTFEYCDKGVYKPLGNYGNSFIECSFLYNNYGYFALGYINPNATHGGMHPGADRFVGGQIKYNDIAGMYVDAPNSYGQFIVDSSIIEANAGFGVFIKLSGGAQMTMGSIDIRNCWMEGNGSSTSAVIIDYWNNNNHYSTTYQPGTITDYRFEGARSVSLRDCYVRSIKLVSSSVALYNCRTDDAYWPGIYDIDSLSQINAHDLRYMTTVNENIFVNSISYDGTADILGDYETPTSVWGPLRVVTQTGNKNILISQRYEDELFLFETIPSSGISQFTSTAKGGILHPFCARLSCPVGIGYPELADVTNIAYLDEDSAKYYVWSIHAFWCRHEDGEDAAYGVIGSVADPNIQLGQVILKSNQWVCSYGVKKLNGSSGSPIPIYLRFGLSNGGTVLFCDYQIVKFDNFYDATSFLNSRAFAEGEDPCKK